MTDRRNTGPEIVDRRSKGRSESRDRRQRNRRAFPRWPAEYEVVYGVGKDRHPGTPVDIGEAGMSFHSEKTYPLETEVNLEYRLLMSPKHTPIDGEWVKVKAVVRYQVTDKVGVEFLNLRLADRLRILDYISSPPSEKSAD